MSSRNIADGISLRAQNNDSFDFANLKISGEVVLTSSDLAANGGTVVEENRNNTFGTNQTIRAAINGALSLNIDNTIGNSWKLASRDNGDAELVVGGSGGREFAFKGDGTDFKTASFSVAEEIELNAQNGSVFGSPTNNFMGAGTLNAEALYDNGDRVYSPNNKPTNSELNLGNAAARSYTVSSSSPSGGSSGDVHYQV